MYPGCPIQTDSVLTGETPEGGEREVQGGERTCQGQMCLWSYFLPFLWEENTFQPDGLVDRERETEKSRIVTCILKVLGVKVTG